MWLAFLPSWNNVFDGFLEKNAIFDEPAVNHDKPGAGEQSSVDWDVFLIQSC